MEANNQKKWYQKKAYWIAGAIILVIIALSSDSDISQQSVQGANPNVQYAVPLSRTNSAVNQPTAPTTQNNTGPSNDNYYTNSSGVEVHSPAHSETVPVGASAQCRDGTYSFSQHRSGTCSHHGGVAQWL